MRKTNALSDSSSSPMSAALADLCCSRFLTSGTGPRRSDDDSGEEGGERGSGSGLLLPFVVDDGIAV